MIMPAASALPDGFSWLAESCRPSPQEVESYTRFIMASVDGVSVRPVEAVRREAELQLWIWRTENLEPARRRPPRRNRAVVRQAGVAS